MSANKYVVLVDHHLPFANAFRDLFVVKVPNADLEIVDNARDALKRLASRPCDLVIADLRLPEVDGLQLLLRLRQSHPSLTKVVMAAHASPRDSQRAKEYGSVLYVEKPATQPDYEVAVNKIAEILAETPEVTRGGLQELGLEETIPDEDKPAKDCTLMVYGPENTGSVFVQAGRVLHAETMDKRGSEALNEILAWPGGLFERRPFHEPVRRSLDIPWPDVVSVWIEEKRKEKGASGSKPRLPVPESAPGSPVAEQTPSAPPGAARIAGDSDQVMPPPPAGEITARLRPAPAESAPSPRDVRLDEEFLRRTGAQFALQIDAKGKVQQQVLCPDVKLLVGVATFTAAKAREIAQLFQWEAARSVHYMLGDREVGVLLFADKTILIGWVSGQAGVLEAINVAFERDLIDIPIATKPRLAGTIDSMKKIPSLHGYAIFNKDHQILVKKFSPQWGFDLLQGTCRIATQLRMVLSLQKLSVKLAQVKFETGSVFAVPATDLMLLVISHTQAKVPLLKDCLLRVTANEINKAVL